MKIQCLVAASALMHQPWAWEAAGKLFSKTPRPVPAGMRGSVENPRKTSPSGASS